MQITPLDPWTARGRVAEDWDPIESSHRCSFGNQVVAIFAVLKCIHILVIRFFPRLLYMHVYFNNVSALWYDKIWNEDCLKRVNSYM